MQKKILIGAAVAVIVLAAAIIYTSGGFDRFINSTPAEATQQVDVKEYTASYIAEYMHEMANTLIVAGDGKIWHTKSMDKKNISEVQQMLSNSEDFDEKDELLQIINAWSQGDFAHIVDDHNFVWKMLDGNVGQAVGINEEGVTKALENLK